MVEAITVEVITVEAGTVEAITVSVVIVRRETGRATESHLNWPPLLFLKTLIPLNGEKWYNSGVE